MRELNLDQLRTLVSAVDLGTFSAAAAALHLSQPTVSLHVAELEERLGVRLLLRGSGGVKPTGAGFLLVQRARSLLRDAEEAVEAIRRHAAGTAGRVRLGATTSIVTFLLPEVLRSMEVHHADIDVDIRIVGTFDALSSVTRGDLDVALVGTQEVPDDLVVRRWRRDPMMAFMPESWMPPRRVTPRWLAGKPLIANDATTILHRQTVEWFASGGVVPQPRIEMNYTEAMKSLVAAGYGAAILPVEGPTAAAALPGIRMAPLNPVLWRETWIVHRALPVVDGATLKLLETLKQIAQW
ncbi:LysR family transcriptional regulator [Roseateles sp.]|uniref:LysR family transcriptional regulator n=1 Tax=Roseateles sp. TaxID=1971397 RepID=UPI0039ED10B7